MFQTPSIIHRVKTLADGGIEVTIHTPELDAISTTQLFEYRRKEVWVGMKASRIQPDELKIEESVEFKGDKTPSQRLRDRMIVYYKKLVDPSGKGFEVWRAQQMDAIGLSYLEKLD